MTCSMESPTVRGWRAFAHRSVCKRCFPGGGASSVRVFGRLDRVGVGLLLVFALFCPSAASALAGQVAITGESLELLLKRVESNLGDVRSLKAAFVQEKHLSLFSDVIRSEGITCFVRPDKVRLEFVTPFRSVMIANGSSVAKYENTDGSWRRLNIGTPDLILMVTGQIATWLQGRFNEMNDVYAISANRVDDGRHIIVLTPRDAAVRKNVAAVELALSDGETRIESVTIRDGDGDHTLLEFGAEARNIDIPDEMFDTAKETPAFPATPSAANGTYENGSNNLPEKDVQGGTDDK